MYEAFHALHAPRVGLADNEAHSDILPVGAFLCVVYARMLVCMYVGT